MATTITNSAYKVKIGTVATTVGLVPEAGAIVWSIADGGLMVSDGAAWAAVGGGGGGSTV